MNNLVSADTLPGSENDDEWQLTRPGEHFLVRVPVTKTGGKYSFCEIVSDPGDGTPLHCHRNEDEHIFVVEGTARFAYGDKIFDAEAGTMVTLPKNIPHAWGNRTSSPLRLVVVVYPGGVEEVMRTIAKGGDVDIAALAESVGVQVLGPTPF
jgi:mannose-6-phosphate isomerase-like protein (cupin superfamily)